ncbi:cytochrome P450 [Backusella circina FSU 941]|nr:cytochrome P450 [Backusella circina FSU 941]
MDIEKYFKDLVATKTNVLEYIPNRKNVKDLARVFVFSLTAYYVMKALHDKYGHVVRLSPDTISVTDKDIIKTVLVTEDLPKSPLYHIISGKSGTTLFTTTDKDFHRQRRRNVSSAFSVKYLVSLEPYMTTVTCSLMDQIIFDLEKTKDAEGYGTVDLWSLSQRFSLDVIGETGFGQTFDMLKNNNHVIPNSIKKELKMKFLKDIISKRANSKDNTRKDILQAFINSKNAANAEDRLSDDAIIAETGLLLSSGSETTGSTLGFILIELLKNPDKLKKLCKEIDEMPLEEGQKVFPHDQLRKLPYLNGAINEGLRLHTAIAIGLPRITDKEIALSDQLTLPKGITVMVNQYLLQRSADYWEEPDSFIPERWIPGEECHVKEADPDAFYAFSGGTRGCIGKNFSLQEIRLALSAIVKHFELKPIEQELKSSDDQRVYITLMLKNNSFKVKMRQR